MKSNLKKWFDFEFSSGTGTGADYLSFQRSAKNELKKNGIGKWLCAA